jgi:Glucosyl transferase GtrII
LNASTARATVSQFAAPFWAVLAVNVIARGQALFALYSIDSYDVAWKSFGGEIAYSLGDGRFIRAGIWWLQAQIGFLPIESMPASICLAIPLFIISGFIFAAAIVEDIKQKEAFGFAALFTLHPFATEYFYYGEVTLATVLAVFFAASAVWTAYRAPPSLIWRCVTAAAVVLALGNYQVVIGHIAAGSLLVLVASLCVSDSASMSDFAVQLGSFLRRTAVLVIGFIILRRLPGFDQASIPGSCFRQSLSCRCAGFLQEASRARFGDRVFFFPTARHRPDDNLGGDNP